MIQVAEVLIENEEIEKVVEVLRSGRLREGEKCKAFEDGFAKKVGAKYATTAANGTAALHMAYSNLISSGDEVLVPSFTFFATASMIVWAGGIPVFCDIDPKTFCIDVQDAEKKITSKTRGIAAVHLFGNACDIDGIVSLAKEHNLKIIWDAAQAHLTQYKERDVGSYGNAVCYSFYATKNMTTGEGGMITSNDKDFIEQCILFKHQGQNEKYRHMIIGTNYRMTDIQAAIGLHQLKKIDLYTDRRRKNAEMLDRGLSEIEGLKVPYVSEEVRHCYHQYTVLLPKEMDRPLFIQKLKERGIGCGVNYPTPLHRQPALEKFVKNESILNAEDISKRCVSLPVHPGLNVEDVHRIIDAVKGVFGS